MHAGVAGNSFDDDLHPIPAGGAKNDSVRRSAIPVERQLWRLENAAAHMSGAIEPRFLLNSPEEGQGRMLRLALQNRYRCRQENRAAGSVVSAQPCVWV